MSEGLQLRGLAKSFGARTILRSLDLEVARGEFLTILGESGSGKTTLLRLIAGFEKAGSGEIWLDGQRLDLLPPYQRPVNTVFQHYALFPHLSVYENVAYGLRVGKAPAAEIPERVRRALAMVKMGDFEKSAPGKLSGGQQQRVGLARALVNRPRMLLLDEPLSALDAILRRDMQSELKALQREVGITFLFVTHDQEEALAMSDRVALLRAGHLEQVATPREIYESPATEYVARFIGQTNLLQAEVDQGQARWNGLSWACSAPAGPVLLSLRPECLRPDQGGLSFAVKLRQKAFAGATEVWEVETEQGQVLRARLPCGLADCQRFEFDPAEARPVRPS